jgi:hypothetical protein
MTALGITKRIAVWFGLAAALCWTVSALGDTRLARSLLPWITDPAVPIFQATMNAYAAGASAIAAFAQTFLTLRD